jgi:hypothetical protein
MLDFVSDDADSAIHGLFSGGYVGGSPHYSSTRRAPMTSVPEGKWNVGRAGVGNSFADKSKAETAHKAALEACHTLADTRTGFPNDPRFDYRNVWVHEGDLTHNGGVFSFMHGLRYEWRDTTAARYSAFYDPHYLSAKLHAKLLNRPAECGPPTWLYYARVDHMSGVIGFKIGITSVGFSLRFQGEKLATLTPLQCVLFPSRFDACLEEERVLRANEKHRVFPTEFLSSRGGTEVFDRDVLGAQILAPSNPTSWG